MMRGSLTRRQNFLSELGAEDLLAQIRLSALVTLMVEKFFFAHETRGSHAYSTRVRNQSRSMCKGTGEENVSWAFPLLHRAQKLLSGQSIGFSSSSQPIRIPNRRSNGETIPQRHKRVKGIRFIFREECSITYCQRQKQRRYWSIAVCNTVLVATA